MNGVHELGDARKIHVHSSRSPPSRANHARVAHAIINIMSATLHRRTDARTGREDAPARPASRRKYESTGVHGWKLRALASATLRSWSRSSLPGTCVSPAMLQSAFSAMTSAARSAGGQVSIGREPFRSCEHGTECARFRTKNAGNHLYSDAACGKRREFVVWRSLGRAQTAASRPGVRMIPGFRHLAMRMFAQRA